MILERVNKLANFTNFVKFVRVLKTLSWIITPNLNWVKGTNNIHNPIIY